MAESQPIFTEKTISSRPVGHHQPMFTPALVVDGQVKIAGKVPSLEDTKKLLV